MNWKCPYCNQTTTITAPNRSDEWHVIDIAASHLRYGHRVGVHYYAISCPNPDCREMYLKLDLNRAHNSFANEMEPTLESWQLLPESAAKPQPAYIPSQIVNDYMEACRIKDLSPKASATLARRCLQGIIRDFWGIKKNNLKEAIDELEEKVTPEVWEAIDAVRSVGNIGAHMEEDVNLIVEIDPAEAELLINLIEDLFMDWYVVRHDRNQRQVKLKELANSKKEQRKTKNKDQQ
jgi:Domain of unknown function (DUF4145)